MEVVLGPQPPRSFTVDLHAYANTAFVAEAEEAGGDLAQVAFRKVGF